MTTEITIIDIDLGESVENIIKRTASSVSKETKEAIKVAVQEHKKTEETKRQTINNKNKKENAIEEALGIIFDHLLKETEQHRQVPAKEIIALVSPAIPNLLSFTNRMRIYLKKNGNEYRLVSRKSGGEMRYTLEPFNLSD